MKLLPATAVPSLAFIAVTVISQSGCQGQPEWNLDDGGFAPEHQPLSVSMAPGYFFLARKGEELCAVRFTNSHGWDKAVYESFPIVEGESELSFEGVVPVNGEVFELFERQEVIGDDVLVKDVGSEVRVTCGASSFVWSSSNWVYSSGDWEFARTRCPTLECVSKQYQYVHWLHREE